MCSPLHRFALQLLGKQVGCVDLYDDLALEVASRVHVHVGVGDASKTKFARMGTSPIRVDRPVERQVVAGDVVDDGLRLGLDELDPAELRRIEGPSPELEECLAGHAPILEHMFDSRKGPKSRFHGAGPSFSRAETARVRARVSRKGLGGAQPSGRGRSGLRWGTSSTPTIAAMMRAAPSHPNGSSESPWST
jgi:hypothetical protein